MIPLLLSIMFGAGVYLIYEGLTTARPQSVRSRTFGPVERALYRSGLRGATPRDVLLVSATTAAMSGAVAHLALGWSVMSLLAAALGGVAPLAYLIRRH